MLLVNLALLLCLRHVVSVVTLLLPVLQPVQVLLSLDPTAPNYTS